MSTKERGNVGQGELFDETENLFEQLITDAMLEAGFKAVKRNRGSAGIDGVTIEDFEERLDEELTQLKKELISWSYKPKPVRRVEIPKPNGGVRLLGVPCIRDRVVQTSIKLLLEPIFDPGFSEHSYGFRPGRNQKQAIAQAKAYAEAGKEYVVDIDLSKFFDRINHDRLIMLIKRKIDDKRIIRLIGLTVRSGVMSNGDLQKTLEGTTQGSPLSPLLSNIVLDELDKELETRGHSFCRFADDLNVYVKSKKAGQRVMESLMKLLEKKMKLVVNRDKSKVAKTGEVKFLGISIVRRKVQIAKASMNGAMEKIKKLTPRGTSVPLEKTIESINQWYRGWSTYFEVTQYPKQFAKLEAHIRRRLRAQLVRNLKRKRYMVRALVKAGVREKTAMKTVYSNKAWWALSHTSAFERMYPNAWFEEKGLFLKSKEKHAHWVTVSR